MNLLEFFGTTGKIPNILYGFIAKETTEDKINKMSDNAADAVQNVVEKPSIIKKWLEDLIPQGLDFILNILLVILVIFIARKIVKAVIKIMNKSLNKFGVEKGVNTFLCSLVKYSIYILIGMGVLAKFGLASSVVALVGSAGLTMGLALQGSLSNFAGGVLILLLKPFVVGDYIINNSSKEEGTVHEITIFYTKLLTVDNRMILIPNGTLSNTSLTNVSKMDERMVDLTVGVGYESDLSIVKTILRNIAVGDERILRDKEIKVFVSDLGESAVDMRLRVWVKSEDYWNVKWDLTEEIKNQLDLHHINIPYPQMDVSLKKE
ncbi:mechanosensitive ion channel family protein [Lachnobacterium bovis]|uniref:Small conductance mechanosensitive channel n=1 Tax=Lachnobacterium bovis TaxID=140626 RepID=A0A1H9RJM5_9FIRM|nr:mechanosensitive ion channel domain-containing protein [Lachnobacterium bovis]SER72149.1 small conductance mechanosensitive channel [Lachnobacterium bovis]